MTPPAASQGTTRASASSSLPGEERAEDERAERGAEDARRRGRSEIPRARRSGGYMSAAAARGPAGSSPARRRRARSRGSRASAGVDRAAERRRSSSPTIPARQPPASTGTRPYRSISRPAGSAASAPAVRKIAGPSPRIPSIPVTSDERDGADRDGELDHAGEARQRRREQDRVAPDRKRSTARPYREQRSARPARNAAAPPCDGWRTYGPPSRACASRPIATTRRPSRELAEERRRCLDLGPRSGGRFELRRCRGCVGTTFQSRTSSSIPSSASVRWTIVAVASAGPLPVSWRSDVNGRPETRAPR